ncbi:hypothetical protein [Streptomyces sp. SID9727]|uniref:hypothetical protein n=1 Tax=Streptomyces sp. SID9727 TaxID=2706114 RepID=UPI0013C8F62F|nr:hypothetical protein [Streptomyces sp. SID9727]NEC69347.1 hypothetical protein [Streptomyces sp. SID9727]
MNGFSLSQRAALVLVFAGISLAGVGSVLAAVLDEPAWRWLSAGAVVVQLIGWVLYGRARRGGGA